MNDKWRDGRTRENRSIRALVRLLAKEVAEEWSKKDEYIASILLYSVKKDGNIVEEDIEDIPFWSWLGPIERKAEKEFLREERRRERERRLIEEMGERTGREE